MEKKNEYPESVIVNKRFSEIVGLVWVISIFITIFSTCLVWAVNLKKIIDFDRSVALSFLVSALVWLVTYAYINHIREIPAKYRYDGDFEYSIGIAFWWSYSLFFASVLTSMFWAVRFQGSILFMESILSSLGAAGVLLLISYVIIINVRIKPKIASDGEVKL